MRKLILSALVAIATQFSLSAQDWCLTNSPQQVIQDDPLLTDAQKEQLLRELPKWEAKEQKIRDEYKNGSRKAGKKIIPVVIHVLHNNGPENITDAQAIEGLRQMTLDFANANPGRDDIVAPFDAISVDSEIEFRLATIDPTGNCTSGVIRHQVPNPYFNNENNLIESYKNQFAWDVDKYFNIYVLGSIGCTDGSCTLGYARFPNTLNGFNKKAYGFVAVYDNFTAPATDRSSGVGTHEMGHALNLSHTWGNGAVAASTNCSSDDGVDDTPNTIGNQSTCNKSAVNCGSLDNVQNYMDYSFCFANFTQGQVDRMQAAVDTYLSNQTSAANLIATGTDYASRDELTALCEVIFKADGESETVVCPGASVTYTDQSYHNPTSWNWTFEGATPSSSSDQNPTVVYTTPGSYSVTLEITNSSGTISDTRTQVVRVADNLGDVFPILENFEPYATTADQDLFIISNPGENNAFEITNTAGYQSSKSFKLSNIGEGSGNSDALISNVLDISKYSTASDMRFTFKYAFAGRTTAHTDKLSVAYSDDCGVTWKTRKTISGVTLETANATSSPFTPSNDGEWKEASVTVIGITLNSNFRIRFLFEGSSAGNNFYLDDINIYHKNEVGISEKAVLANTVSVFPIPAKEIATIAIQVDKAQSYKVDVLDLTGRVVANVLNEQLSTGSHQATIQVNNFKSGVYFVRVTANGESVIKRLIVSK